MNEMTNAQIEEVFAKIPCVYSAEQSENVYVARHIIAAHEAQRQAGQEGWTLAPAYRGYALLGLGQYVINHTHQDEPPELIVSVATTEEKAGRAVGEERDNEDDKLIQPDEMAVRIAFHGVAGLDALEAQLQHLRRVHFPTSVAPQNAQEPLTDEQIDTAIRNYFADEWAIEKARGLLGDLGIGKGQV